jgi:transposase-like protein
MRKYRSPSQVNDLMKAAAAARSAGATLKDAAAQLGVSVPYLHTLLAKADGQALLDDPVSRADKHRDEIVSMYRQTAELPNAVEMIADALVIPQAHVYKLLVEAGEIIPKRQQNINARIEVAIEIVRLYNEEGKSVPEIAMLKNISVPSVYKILQYNLVQLRSKRHQSSLDAAQLYQDGLSVVQIAKQLDMSPSNVYPLLYEAGIDPRKTRQSKKEIEAKKIIELYFDSHLNIADIAHVFGHTETTIWAIVKEEQERRDGQTAVSEIDALYPDDGAERTFTEVAMPAELDELYPDPPEVQAKIRELNEHENDMSV